MATQRDVDRMDWWELSAWIHELASDVDSALGLYGPDAEPITDITHAADAAAVDRAAAELLAPSCRCRRGQDCGHGFPPYFMRAAEPAVRALARAAKQVLRRRPTVRRAWETGE